MNHHLCPPDLKLTTILFGLAILVCGCSSSYTVSSAGKPKWQYWESSYQEMNEKLTGRNVNIELKDGRDISAKEVKISDDSVSWVDLRTDEESKASIGVINKIVMKNPSIGALEGIGFGVVAGAGFGAAIEGIGSIVANVLFRGGSSGISNGLPIGAVAGGIIGLTTGLIVGHSHNYKFPTTEQSDSSKNKK